MVRITLRMPQVVADKVKSKALKEKLSKNSLIIKACQNYLDKRIQKGERL